MCIYIYTYIYIHGDSIKSKPNCLCHIYIFIYISYTSLYHTKSFQIYREFNQQYGSNTK